MPPKEWPCPRLLLSISKVQAYVRGRTLAEVEADRLAVDAILHNLGIVGEAAANIPEAIRDRYPELPWRDARALRNILTHTYFAVHFATVCDTIQQDLPQFAAQLTALLAAEGVPLDE